MTRNLLAFLALAPVLLAVGCASEKVAPVESVLIQVGVDGTTLEDCVLDRVGVVCEVPLAVGEQVELSLRPPEERYVELGVVQLGVDVALSLVDPLGTIETVVDRPSWTAGDEVLQAVLEVGEAHSIRLEGVGGRGKGSLRVEVRESRPVRRGDRTRSARRFAAEELLRNCESFESEGEIEAGREVCAKALAVWREFGDARGEAWALLAQARFLSRAGEVEAASHSFEAAAERFRKNGYRIGQAVVADYQALHLKEAARVGDAVRVLAPAVGLWEESGELENQVRVLNTLGYYSRLRGDVGAAERYVSGALDLQEQLGDPSSVARTLLNLGVLAWDQGESHRALDFYNRAQEALGQAPSNPSNDQMSAFVLTSKGAVFSRLGRLQDALDAYEQARSFARDDDVSLASLALNEGSVMLALGQADGALELWQEALDLYRQAGDRPLEAKVKRYIGWLEYGSGNYESALDHFESALAAELHRDGDPKLEAAALHGRGVTRSALGDLGLAIEDLDRSRGLREASGDRAGLADTLSELGVAYLGRGELKRAAEYVEAAVDLSEQVGEVNLSAVALTRLGRLRGAEGRHAEARSAFRRALSLFENVRGSVVSDEFRSSALARRREFYEQYISYLVDAGGDHLGEAFSISERSRARGLLELLVEAQVPLDQTLQRDLRDKHRELDERASELRGVLSSPTATEAMRAEGREALTELARRRLSLRDELRSAAPAFAELIYPTPASVDQVQELLPAKAALLEYVLGDQSSFLFVVTPDDYSVHRLGLGRNEIAEQVAGLRRLIDRRSRRGRQDAEAFARTSFAAFEAVLAPAARVLAEAEQLFVVPDGSLYYLPFEALVTEPVPTEHSYGELPYLVRSHRVSYAPSASVLAQLDASRLEHSARLDLAVFAAPTLSPRAGGIPPPLPGALEEAQGIVSLVGQPGAVSFLGPEASEANVKTDRRVAEARWLHFASHGEIDPDEPGNSGLVLAAGNGSGEDGFLDLGEIFGLSLSAELVVLSACETGLGKEYRGEGLIGLSRAFFFAGARSLVVTLWKADDRSSVSLMTSFYRRLLAGDDKSEALRRAKLGALETNSTAHPRHWALFTLIGS